MSETTIKICSCANEGQDRLHGKSKRVHNYCESNGNWRCTVCSSEKSGSREDNKGRVK